ncbi:hypothetical protein B0H15DRAFT_925748 [Mycena belliarum]|uniref:Glutamine synthetase n=1 Tax=Mycena belliarum TaxID=1033014 RepID=A0AAD6XE86_9AGAR|nr:hypothetical protein B0H15DRAFT_925748 [Mycena belliae]
MAPHTNHAVIYSPQSAPTPPNMDIRALRGLGIRFIRFQWVDLTNNVRYRVIPRAYFEKMLASPRPSICILTVGLGAVFLKIADGFAADSEYLYVPDMSSVRTLPYKPGHASVLGWFEDKAPVPGRITMEAELCPRRILRQVTETARSVSGVEFLVGFETEFILLTSTKFPVTTVHNLQGYSNSLALPTGSVTEKALEEIVDALEASGVEVQMYHAEAAPGQYEIVTVPLPPLQAVDALVHTRQTIYNIASKHGLRATLAPRIHDYSCGSAAHAHISVHSATDSASKGPKFTIQESAFLAGLLEHLPATLPFTLPLPASYKRMVDGIFSGGTYVCWGTDNREVPVRLCNATSPASRNFEVKTIDGTANPYLALAALLGAGHKGIASGSVLTMKDCAGPSAAERGEDGRQALGISERLPLTWDEARQKLQGSDVMTEIFGENFVQKYLSVNALMAHALDKPPTEAEKLALLVETY